MRPTKNNAPDMKELLTLKIGSTWQAFKAQHFSFWAFAGYIFVEYVRPQQIKPELDFLPWAQLLLLFSLGGLLLDKNRQPVFLRVNVFMVLFYVSILISTFNAHYPEWSYMHQEFFYTWLIIYFVFILVVNNNQRFFIIFMIIMLASFKMSVFGAKTWALRGFAFTSWGIMGPPGYFQNSGEYAIQMTMFFGMSCYLYLAVKPYANKWISRIVLLFPITAAMSVLGASSRGAQLALLVQCYFIFLHGKISIRSLVLLAVVLMAGYYLMPEAQLARFESVGDDKTSEQRLLYWKRGLEMLNEHPFFGVGYWNFPLYFQDHYPQDMLYDAPQLAHNILVQVAADLGYIGLSIYLMLIYLLFSLSCKTRKLVRVQVGEDDWRFLFSKGLVNGFIGFLVAGQFVSVVYYPFMWIQLALVVALYLIVKRECATPKKVFVSGGAKYD